MAYTVPQFRLFQEFSEASNVATSALNAVILAPHYQLHRYEVESEQSFVVDSTGTQPAQYDYSKGGTYSYPRHVLGAKVDVDSVHIYLEDAPVVYNTFTKVAEEADLAEGSVFIEKNIIKTTQTLHSGNGFIADVEYEIGDTVVVGDTKAKIINFLASGISSNISNPRVTPTSGTAAFAIVDKTSYTGKKNSMYVVVFSKDAEGNVTYTCYDTTGNDSAMSGRLTEDTTAFAVGSKDIQVSVDDVDKITDGTTLTIEATAARTGNYTTVVLDQDVADIETTEVEFCRYATVILNSTQFTADSLRFTLTPGITFVSIDATGEEVSRKICGGSIFVDYRERLYVNSKEVGYIDSVTDLETVLGPAVPQNPLSLMVRQALYNSNGAPIYYVAVAEDTPEGYLEALNAVERVSDLYSIVPYSTDAAVQEAVFAYIKERSSAVNMDWKIGWFGCDVDRTITTLDTFVDGSPLIVTVDNNRAIMAGIADLAKVMPGDKLNVIVIDGIEKTVKEFIIDYCESDNKILLADASGESLTGTAYITHDRTATEVSNAVAAASARFNNERIRNIFSDGLYVSSDPNTSVSNAYLAAACAGLRSASAPHQPLTRVELNGFVLNPVYNLSYSQLNKMAENGTWLVVNDSATVFIRHQLTTNTTNYNLREDSKVTNGDEISRFYRESLSDYYGRANISNEFMQYLSTVVDAVSYTIASRVYPAALGPQIISYDKCVITVNPMVSDMLEVRVRIDTPEPLNYLDVYLTIS